MMNRILLTFGFSIATFIMFFTSGCNKVSDNGDLDGLWQISSVSFYNNGVYDTPVNTTTEKAYLSFQLDLAQIKWLNRSFQGSSTFLSRFKNTGDSLRLYNFYKHFRTTDSLFTAKDTLLLAPLGFRGFENKFKILEGGDEYMKLQSSYAIIELKKF